MHAVYNFVAGPLLWVTAAVFLGGVLYRLVSMALLARKKDLVVYSYMDLRYALFKFNVSSSKLWTAVAAGPAGSSPKID